MEPTRTVATRTAAATPSSADGTTGEGRFLPGQIVAERYRIISLIGEGGMGEVYRATDIKLGQPVALKFLPVASTPVALQRFRAEVRITRQISHPNVCRVYDIAELDGQTFLSMEYVDGEDLSSLLRRIGRLPEDKAVDIARQICAGLAAAHDKGVLHRDLKPSNILLDGRGVARVADFGISGVEEVRAGTPAYMAPEQLAGREVTVSSDIYSLGLVLYELFTGKRALQAPGSTPSSPSTLVRDMDPAVERVILQCIETDPAQRPRSALAISAALPGGDPLAAALAAGETPSPALVAAAGEHTGIAPWRAAAMCAAVVAGLGLVWVLRAMSGMWNQAGLDKPPVVLEHHARDLMAAMGYPDKPRDTASGYHYNGAYLQYRTRHLEAQYPAMTFWYRESPSILANQNPMNSGVTVGAVTDSSPPVLWPGHALISLDPAGRLTSALIRPPERLPVSSPFDWNRFLPAAGFDISRLTPVTPEWTPPVGFDQRAAWTGTVPEFSNLPLRIEAAALGGKLVWFTTLPPWVVKPEPQSATGVWRLFPPVLLLSMILAGILLARRNLRFGRGDRKGATRVAMAILILHMIGFAFGADHIPELWEFDLMGLALATGLFKATMLWLAYIGLEPLVRKRLPHGLISWTRLTSGRWRDPVVGRDVLAGLLAGVGAHLFFGLDALVRSRLDGVFSTPVNTSQAIGGLSATLALIPNECTEALLQAFGMFLVFFLFRLLTKRDSLAVAMSAVLMTLQSSAMYADSVLPAVVLATCAYALVFAVIIRVGLTGAVAAMLAADLLFAAPAAANFNLWFAPWALLMYGTLAVVAFAAFRIALAGRPLFPAGDA